MSANTSLLIPNVSSLPVQGESISRSRPLKGHDGEFGKVLEQVVGRGSLTGIESPLKFSTHAAQRMQDRHIQMDPETANKVREAVDKAAAKGIEESLIITNDAAYIVSVKNKTVITALDKDSLNGNVFSNIDGAVIV